MDVDLAIRPFASRKLANPVTSGLPGRRAS